MVGALVVDGVGASVAVGVDATVVADVVFGAAATGVLVGPACAVAEALAVVGVGSPSSPVLTNGAAISPTASTTSAIFCHVFRRLHHALIRSTPALPFDCLNHTVVLVALGQTPMEHCGRISCP